MEIEDLNGEHLVFEYRPNLTIFGGYHSLNDSDRQTLNQLVQESDFVAIESDKRRISDNPAEPAGVGCLRYFKRGYNPVKDEFYLGIFQIPFFMALNKGLMEHAPNSNRTITNKTGVKRDTAQSELEFSYQRARTYGKDVHLVDMPAGILASEVLRFPIKDKLEIWRLIRSGTINGNQRLDRLLEQDRENYMLARLFEHEGRLDNLAERGRKGLLVVGLSHAINYAERAGYSI